jgi:hypothetical protein
MLTLFNLPICSTSFAQILLNESDPESPGAASLATKSGLLGDSEGAKSRMETFGPTRFVVKAKMCGSGFNLGDGIESDGVDVSAVGGSYLRAFCFSTPA